jgi:16S rRNA (guanine527-N7)-methyltransferase
MRLAEPALQLTLIESHGRRAAFLETLVAALDLDGVEVMRARAEEAGRDPSSREAFDLVTARAVAPLVVLVEYAMPLLRPGGVLVTPKGSNVEDEIADAAGALDMLRAEVAEPIVLTAVSDREGTEREEAERPRVVIVRRVGDLDDRYPRRPGIPSKRPLGGSRASGGAR